MLFSDSENEHSWTRLTALLLSKLGATGAQLASITLKLLQTMNLQSPTKVERVRVRPRVCSVLARAKS
jgi:hypothetical protein